MIFTFVEFCLPMLDIAPHDNTMSRDFGRISAAP
jgi:hypothetical protein